MESIEITIHLPEDLVRQARALNRLSDEHIATLLRTDIEGQLEAMARDPQIQFEIKQINDEFAETELDGLEFTE